MKPNHLIIGLSFVTALFVASCSGPRMAQNASVGDDVYYTSAQARQYAAINPRAVNDTLSNESYAASDDRYDQDYASRIDRFYYGSPNRDYYDPSYNYYGYNNYYGNWGYDPFWNGGFGMGMGMGMGFGWNGYFGNAWNNPYSYWGFYGGPRWNTWGPYSYWGGGFGGWGGGYWGGGGWGGGGYWGGTGTARINSPRPSRGSENGIYRGGGRPGYAGGTSGIPARGTTGNVGNPNSIGRTRAEMYNPSNGANGNGAVSNSRPTRGSAVSSGSESRPSRGEASSSRPTNTQPSRPTYTPPAQSTRPTYTPPPSSSGGGSRGESGGGGGGGGGRPTRGGRG